MDSLFNECVLFISTSDREDESLYRRCDNIQTLFYLRAVKMGHLEILRLLLDRDHSYLDKNLEYAGITLLTGAIKYQQIPIIRFLIQRGANINKAAYKMYTSLEYACEKQYYDIITLLLASGANPNGRLARPLHIAAEKNDIRLVQELLDAGADTTCTKGFGDKLAYELTTNEEIKELIMNYGQDPDVKEPEQNKWTLNYVSY
jgi:ankyrin repeat protein